MGAKYKFNVFSGDFDIVSSTPIGTSDAYGVSVNTGALTAGVKKTVPYGFTATSGDNVILSPRYEDNIPIVQLLAPTPSSPTTSFDIEVSVDIPEGILIQIVNY